MTPSAVGSQLARIVNVSKATKCVARSDWHRMHAVDVGLFSLLMDVGLQAQEKLETYCW
jgi:hypothetical protein